MKIKLKCYAFLSRHLPAQAKANAAEVEIKDKMSVYHVIKHFGIDQEEAYLVILNGVFIYPPDRDSTIVVEGDTLALWPEVAGG